MESHACRNLILQMRAELESEWISLNSEIWVRFLFVVVYLMECCVLYGKKILKTLNNFLKF